MGTEQEAEHAAVQVPAQGETNTGSVMSQAEVYLPPWRERQPDGSLGSVYGPNSTRAYAVAVQRHRDWAWKRPSKEAQREDADALRAFMRNGGAELVPDGELRVYRMIYEDGMAVRTCARKLGIRRETVKSYIKRLKARIPYEEMNP